MPILDVKDLKKSFKEGVFSPEKKVLSGVSFSIDREATTGFLGVNGSGKTTTLKCVLGLIKPDQGDISFFDQLPLSRTVLERVGFLPEHPCFYEFLTGEELLIFYGRLCTSMKWADIKSRARSLLKQLNLYDAKDQKIKVYSKGMLQRVGLAGALIHEPEFIVLDEPMAGLDPDGRFYVGELIQNMAQKGITIFFSSHLLYDVERLCKNLVVLKNGSVAYEGPVQNLLDQIEGKRQIMYSQDGQKKTIFVRTVTDCQKEIDRLRRMKCEILKVQLDKKNLEQAFIELAHGEKSKEGETHKENSKEGESHS